MTVRKSATDNGFIIFKDQLSLLKLIPDEQLGKSIKLLLENFDELPEMNDMAYEMIAANVRRYREQVIKSRECGLRGGNPTLKGTDNPTVKLQENTRKENIYNNINNNRPVDNVDNCSEKKVLIEEGKFHIDETMPEYKDLLCNMGNCDELCVRVWKWVMSKYEGKEVKISFIRSLIEKFKK